MASTWITRRTTKRGDTRFRVEFRAGGRESRTSYGGSFRTLREAKVRRDVIAGELAALRMPQLQLAEPEQAQTFAEAAKRWQASRVDIAEATRTQHRIQLDKLLPLIGSKRIDTLRPQGFAEVVTTLHGQGFRARDDP